MISVSAGALYPLCRDDTVPDGQAADSGGAPVVFRTVFAGCYIPAVVDRVILALVFDDAVMAGAFFCFVFDQCRGEFPAIGMLLKINSGQVRRVGSRGGVANVVAVVFEVGAAVHDILPAALLKPEGSFQRVPVSSVTVTVGMGDLFVKGGDNDLSAQIGGGLGIDQPVHKDPDAEPLRLPVFLRIE